MTSLVPRTPGQLSTAFQAPEGMSRNSSKKLARLNEEELVRGIVTATNVQAKGFVTMVGIQLVGALCREADFQHGGDPRVAARTDLLLDQFTMAVANEIGRM